MPRPRQTFKPIVEEMERGKGRPEKLSMDLFLQLYVNEGRPLTGFTRDSVQRVLKEKYKIEVSPRTLHNYRKDAIERGLISERERELAEAMKPKEYKLEDWDMLDTTKEVYNAYSKKPYLARKIVNNVRRYFVLLGYKDPKMWNDDDIAFIRKYIEDHYSKGSWEPRISQIRRYLEANGLLKPEWKTGDRYLNTAGTKPDPEPVAFSISEVKAIEDAIESLEDEYDRNLMRAVWRTAFATAFRCGENVDPKVITASKGAYKGRGLCGLRIEHLGLTEVFLDPTDPNKGTRTVHSIKGYDKGTVLWNKLLTDRSYEAIRTHLADRGNPPVGYLFAEKGKDKMTPRFLRQMMKVIYFRASKVQPSIYSKLSPRLAEGQTLDSLTEEEAKELAFGQRIVHIIRKTTATIGSDLEIPMEVMAVMYGWEDLNTLWHHYVAKATGRLLKWFNRVQEIEKQF